MRNQSAIAVALGTSFKQQCINNHLDVQIAAPRFAAERFLAHWQAGMGKAPFMVTGGLMCPQSMRPTKDADIVTVRHYTNLEVQRGFRVIATLLEAEGTAVKSFSREAKMIDTGHEPVARYKVDAFVGTLRASFDIDMATAVGPDAFPTRVPLQDLPKIFENNRNGRWPVLRARVQPFESSAAEKWLAVIMQPESDIRVKHLADLLCYQAMELDVTRVAEEIIRVARHRGIPLAVCAPSPATLRWPKMRHRAEEWKRLCAERGIELTYGYASMDISSYWRETHSALSRILRRGCRRRPPVPDNVDGAVAFPKPAGARYALKF
ncbi:nucleotidyl transferase AbiEii/AbiGii toxin family protein [Rhizobium sp. Leaf383]|uniref:nucleotidyl transferase AbiEii/AbiGii toxin family protein n=1 Tax=Rhizobium sp. Leaf383 TaxID=1736357 RepID=UPI000714E997|nr:nucleotidyl transferase AbiEii/AbiGii toxin family protein [Rhizobium sp. Leaf383]KQS84843.1 hypothetical protein ASG58_20335 [Rhizobium sp. Leaf383]